MTKTLPWRFAFFLSGVAMLAGGPRHPGPRLDESFLDSTAAMLADPAWVPSHLGLLAANLLLLLALALWQRWARPAGRARAWTRFALAAAALAAVEMAFHTAAVLDLERLRAGGATPILTTHLAMVVLTNPLLGVAVAAVAILGARLRRLGSLWIAWLPVLGGALWGFAGVYVVTTHDQRVSPLFAISSALLALWFILVAIWPVRSGPRFAGPGVTAGMAGA